MAARFRHAPPRAGALIESLRGLGYTTAAALADIIDNSVSANATLVDVHFEWDQARSWIRIIDNGHGMSDPELEAAMRLGSRDPRETRATGDLGRFGMGLKTASFSQARRLTVASRRKGMPVSCLRWDLDQLAGGEGDWALLEGPDPGSESALAPLQAMPCGTIVLWEMLDRIVTDGFGADDLFETIDQVEAALAMTFHRLLDDTNPALEIRINGKAILPWDPFMTGHPAKAWESPLYAIPDVAGVSAQCHVLPHKDMLTKTEYERAAGPAGWASQQGFYIYRNRRLLIAGGWLKLGERGKSWMRDEPHRLARIRVDIPNTADADWKINILKSTASPPVRLKSHLRRLGAETREKARAVFAHRGRLLPVQDGPAGRLPDAWLARRGPRGTSYRISREHDLVKSVLERSGPLRMDLEALFKLVEETVPVQRIWLDTAGENEAPVNDFSQSAEEDVLGVLQVLFDTMVQRRGLTPETARARLLRTPPFHQYPALVAGLK